MLLMHLFFKYLNICLNSQNLGFLYVSATLETPGRYGESLSNVCLLVISLVQRSSLCQVFVLDMCWLCVCVSLSLCLCLSISVSVFSLPLPPSPSNSVSSPLSLSLSVRLSLSSLSLSLPPRLSNSVSSPLSLSVRLCLSLSLSVCLSVCLSLSLPPFISHFGQFSLLVSTCNIYICL